MADSSLHAVHDDDLDSVLQALGLTQAFAKGELPCKFCNDVITRQNLHSLLPESGAVKLVCDKPDCVRSLLRYLDDRKKE